MKAISATVGEDGETSVSDNYLSAAMADDKFCFYSLYFRCSCQTTTFKIIHETNFYVSLHLKSIVKLIFRSLFTIKPNKT